MIARLLALPAAVWILSAPAAIDLRPHTLKAFERYVQLTEARIATETSGAAPFLWIDRQPEAAKNGMLTRLRQGEVVVERLQTRDGKAEIDVDDGLLHHWIGTVLLPQVKLDRAIAFVQNYPKYPVVFAPLIQRAQVTSQSPERFAVTMRTWTKKVITVVVDADYVIEYRRLGPPRVYSRSIASNVREVSSAGTASESSVPAERGQGFLWRLNTYCSFEERNEGVYEQCETVSLTRDIPFGLGWIIRPIVSGMPRETLAFTLGKVRSGVAK